MMKYIWLFMAHIACLAMMSVVASAQNGPQSAFGCNAHCKAVPDLPAAGLWETRTVTFSQVDGRKKPPMVALPPEWQTAVFRYRTYKCSSGHVQVQLNGFCVPPMAYNAYMMQVFFRLHCSDDPLGLFGADKDVTVDWRLPNCQTVMECSQYTCLVGCECTVAAPGDLCDFGCCTMRTRRVNDDCVFTLYPVSGTTQAPPGVNVNLCRGPRVTPQIGTDPTDYCDALLSGQPEGAIAPTVTPMCDGGACMLNVVVQDMKFYAPSYIVE